MIVMAEIEYTERPNSMIASRARVVHLSHINSKNSLLDIIGSELQFPDYYGRNWDALEECLRDLSWVPEREVLLIHDDLPSLEDHELRTYIQILSEAVESWASTSEHHLRAVFSTADEPQVRSLGD
jgi:RNAse (barnase) inhibitor barstar